jgi:hypothetical protein
VSFTYLIGLLGNRSRLSQGLCCLTESRKGMVTKGRDKVRKLPSAFSIQSNELIEYNREKYAPRRTGSHVFKI